MAGDAVVGVEIKTVLLVAVGVGARRRLIVNTQRLRSQGTARVRQGDALAIAIVLRRRDVRRAGIIGLVVICV